MVKKILAVINATYAVAKRKPEKIRLASGTSIAEVRVRIPASLIFSGFLFATA